MPDPDKPEPKEGEQYGPPLPPRQRQWRMPSTTETIARDVGLGGAFDALRKGEVQVPDWMKVLEPIKLARSVTGWELPTSEEALARSGPETQLRKELHEQGRGSVLPPWLETLPGDALSMLSMSPIVPGGYTRPGADPLQDVANVYNRSRQAEPPRQGTTAVTTPEQEQQSYLEPQEDGTFLTRTP